MKTSKIIVGLGILAALIPTTTPMARAQAAAPVTLTVTEPANSIWDVGMAQELQNIDTDISSDVHVRFASPFIQDGKGKLSGSGDTQVSLDYYEKSIDDMVTVPTFPALYRFTGSISSAKGVVKLTCQVSATGLAFMRGKSRKATITGTQTVVVDAATRQITGRYNKKASAVGMGGTSDQGAVSESIPPELGDGSWTLTLNFKPPTGNKLNGDATIILNSGHEYTFSVTGVYTANTQLSKVTLKGTGSSSGSSLTVMMKGSDQVTSVVGRVAGQSVNVVK
jgi:hypothetical protein